MASQFAAPQQEEIFHVYGGNDFQYSNFEYNPNNHYKDERNGRASVPNYMKPTQASRRRAKSADARPQYRNTSSTSSSSKSRALEQQKSYEDRLLDELLEQQFDLEHQQDIDVQRLPPQQQATTTTTQTTTTYQGPQMQLPTQDGDHFMDPNLEEPTERIHFEREMHNPFSSGGAKRLEQPLDRQTPKYSKEETEEEFFNPFGGEWSPEDDKRRWDMPYEPSSSTYPAPNNPATQQQKVQGTRSFPDTSPTYPTPTNSSSQTQSVHGTKSFPSSSRKSSSTASKSQKSQHTGGDWRSTVMKSTMVLKPKTKAVKEQVKAITNKLSSAMSSARSRSQIPTYSKSSQPRSKSQPPPARKNRGQYVADSGIMRRQQQNNNPIPTTNATPRSKDDYGSFDVEYDFYGDGFAQSRTFSHDGSQSDHGFRVIRPERPRNPQMQIKPDAVAPSYTSKRPAPVSYSQYLATSKIPSTKGGAFSKVSPTSVMDSIQNNSNVHWSNRLEPASTPRTIEDNPQSILRKRYPGSINDHDYLIEPTPVDFRDGSGMSLSPIENRTSPAQPQHQNMRTAQPAKSADESDLMSIAYSEFIESVAAVVIQTTVRRFLAKLLVDKLRVQVAAARKYRYNRKRIEGKTITPRPVKVPSVQRTSVQSRSRNRVQQLQQEEESMANTGMEYQLFVFAAIRIQSVFRGWFVRDIIKIEHYCATIIQKNARGLVYRNQYQYDLFRIIMAQSVVRRFLVCRDLYVVAPDPEVRRVLDFAAAMIQARWRGFVAEMRYFQNYRDVLLVQSVVRRWLAIRLVRAIQSLDQHQQKKSTGNNRFGKYGARHSLGNVRVHAHEPVPVVPVQPKSTGTHTSSKWSNTRNVPWQQPSSSSNTTITHSASTEERGSTTSQAKHDVPTGMGSIAKRRAMFESKRLNTVQQEDASKEKAAAAKAELKAMQRKVGVRPSPGTQSISSHPQRAKSMSGRIQNPLSKKNWGPDFRPNTKVVGRVSTFESSSGSVVASDVETEVQSNRTSTSRLLQGWRDREKSNSFDQRNSFDMTSERATTTATEYHGRSSNTRLSTGTIGLSKYLGGKTEHQEAVAPLSHGGGMVHRPPNPSHEQCSNPNSDPEPSFQDIMRSKRSPKESIRIQQIEEVFIKVGLMRPVNRPLLNANVGQPQPSKVERTYLSSPLRKVNNTKVEQSPSGTQAMKNQLPWRVQPSRSLDSSSPKTERKLFHDEPDSGNDNGNSSNEQAQSQAALKIWRNARQPPHANSNSNSNSSRAQQLPPRQQQQQSSGVERRSLGGVGVGANPSPVNERSKNLLNSLGINTSYTSEVSTDVSDMENSPSPAFLRRFQKVTPDSPVPKTNLFGAPEVQSQNKVVSTVNQNHPQRPVFSQFQIQKQAERSQEDQIKIDAMHAVFEKVGLMKSVASIYLYTVVDNE
ncbi:unnamed protein product [Cylindrotheca closterium]|uniref:Uncharacterized protein n=1 Tax=Cylindrotheca closterium TaxID=2856 RepID=A0AAD2CP89_9STRA|nr:unnamed protein product [Cylindrotheca closterium]